MTYDGHSFWVVDWQTNTINKVRPEDGALLLSLPGPSSLPSYQSNPSVTNARPFGITWDGRDLWVADQEELKVYRIDPSDGSVVDFFDTPGADPKGLSWNGEYLWHTDQTTATIYAIETGVIPFGITGCFEKNGVAVNADILLSQTALSDQSTSTDIDGCFQFTDFTAGTPIQLKASEAGVDEKPIIT
ncbi:YncE family protein, partial [Oleiphilus sp. HI0123]